MKIKPLHIFLSLFGFLIICSLFTSATENFESDVNVNDNYDVNRVDINAGIMTPPVATTNTNFDDGIPAAQIPSGDEDLYILKSEMVTPMCPKCPTFDGRAKDKQCTPCPPCARCPEPAFECKKVPNYNATNEWLPGLDFSQFSNIKTY